jgi:hypothetical protein
MSETVLTKGKYELTMEFDNDGDLNPDTAVDIRQFLRVIKGTPNSAYKVTIETEIVKDNYRAKWMNSNEKAKLKKR